MMCYVPKDLHILKYGILLVSEGAELYQFHNKLC